MVLSVEVVVCPGQGSQKSDISDTAIVQPLIVSESLASYAQSGLPATMVAGHSVGMLAAFAIAGCYSFETAISLAEIRGKLFHDAAALTDSGMSAVIGKNVLQVFESLHCPLNVAVVNSDSQIVVAGSKKALAELASNVPRGIRVTALKVSGAFHTETMRPVVGPFAEVLCNLEIEDPKIPVISDLTGELITGGVVNHLLAQITSPVRWDLVTSKLAKLTCEPNNSAIEITELAPSGTLAALLKRALPTAQITALS